MTADKKLVPYAELAIENADLRQRLSHTAVELVRTQDRLDKAEQRLADYDTDTLEMSRNLAAQVARLERFVHQLRQAHPRSCCAAEACPVCALLFSPSLVPPAPRASHPPDKP